MELQEGQEDSQAGLEAAWEGDTHHTLHIPVLDTTMARGCTGWVVGGLRGQGLD